MGYQTKQQDTVYWHDARLDPADCWPWENCVNKSPNSKVVYSYNFISISARLQYTFLKSKKIDLNSSLGIEFSDLINYTHTIYDANNTEVYSYKSNNKENHNYRPTGLNGYLTGRVALNIQYELSKKISLIVEPTYKLLVLPTLEYIFEYNLYSFVLNIGLHYKFIRK